MYPQHNLQNDMSLHSFCSLLKDELLSQTQSIGLFVESDLIVNEPLYAIDKSLNKEEYLSLFINAKNFQSVDDIKLFVFENLLIRLLIHHSNETTQREIINIFSSLEYMKIVLNNNFEYTLDMLLDESVSQGVLIFIEDLHTCDYYTLCDVQEMLDFYLCANINFVICSDELRLKHSITQGLTSTTDNQEELKKFYQSLFHKSYKLPYVSGNSI